MLLSVLANIANNCYCFESMHLKRMCSLLSTGSGKQLSGESPQYPTACWNGRRRGDSEDLRLAKASESLLPKAPKDQELSALQVFK